MKKQILFADGGTVAALGPSDKAALAATAYLEYAYYDRVTHNKQKVFRTRLIKRGVNQSSLQSLGRLCMRLDPNIVGFDATGITYYDLYSSHSYEFYGRNLLETLRELYSKVAPLPSMVDDDQYLATYGRVVTAGPKNYCPKVEYLVPFDMKAWEARHRTTAEVKTVDAKAAQEAADASLRQAEADREAQKAKLAKTLRIALIMLAVVAVVAVVAIIIKNK